MFLQPSLQFRNLILKMAVFLSIIFSSGSNKFRKYFFLLLSLQWHFLRNWRHSLREESQNACTLWLKVLWCKDIRPDIMIQYSISDYHTWPHGSIFDIRISDLTAFANISRISTEDFPLVSNHLPNDKMTNAKMTIVMMTEYDNVSDDFGYEQQMNSWNKSHRYTLERVFSLVVHRSLW